MGTARRLPTPPMVVLAVGEPAPEGLARGVSPVSGAGVPPNDSLPEMGILFRDEMVRQILAGVKWQTRRVAHAGKRCRYGPPGRRLWVREVWAPSPDGQGYLFRADSPGTPPARWKSSMLMPRACSRIALTTQRVRLEHAHEITEPDARAEGFQNVAGFRRYWCDLHGQDSWDANPLVYVIEFLRQDTPASRS